MYRCKECGQEYKVKPDFCDCGNDTFDEIEEPLAGAKIPAEIKRLDKSELLSRIIFAICIILSILVLIFFPKTDNKPQEKTTQKSVNIVKTTNPNIPDLDTFWINSKPTKPQPVEEPAPTPVQQIKEIFVKPRPVPQNIEKPKPVVKKQTTQKPNKPAQTVKKQPPQQQKKGTTTVQKPRPQTSTAKTNTYELLNYKNRLRSALLSNLRFSQVQGSGECGIEFAIDASGKLINRAFTFQSDNKSVNDEVYKMLMRTPRFAAPPTSYKGEKIRMIFKLNNNSYSVEFR